MLDQLEQLAKITATVLVPVIVAIGGWVIQTTIETEKQRATQVGSPGWIADIDLSY